MKFNTALIHGNIDGDEKFGTTTIPIYQAIAFHHKTAEELELIFKVQEAGYLYTRLGNPTIESFERRMLFDPQ